MREDAGNSISILSPGACSSFPVTWSIRPTHSSFFFLKETNLSISAARTFQLLVHWHSVVLTDCSKVAPLNALLKLSRPWTYRESATPDGQPSQVLDFDSARKFQENVLSVDASQYRRFPASPKIVIKSNWTKSASDRHELKRWIVERSKSCPLTLS